MSDEIPVPPIFDEFDPLTGKPVCGSEKEVGDYDLPLHVAGLFLVMLASILGAGFPVVAKKVKWLNVPPKVFFAMKHFGTGVLIATAFVHLLPVAFGSLTNPCLPDLFTDQYPALPGVIMMGSMFCLFVLEMYLNSKTGGHSHGGAMGIESPHGHGHQHGHGASQPHTHYPSEKPSGPPRPTRNTNAIDFETDDVEFEKKIAAKMYQEKVQDGMRDNPFSDANEMGVRSEMPAWFVVFYEQYVRQRLELVKMINQVNAAEQNALNNERPRSFGPPQNMGPVDSPYIDIETGVAVSPEVFRKMSMNITLLEGGILFHSIFVGITISITIDGFIILMVAMLFHQMFEGLGLGTRIAEVPYPRGSPRPWLLVVAFGLTCPLGQAIGLFVRDAYDPNSAFGLIIVGVFNAISSGLLLYAALVDLLAEDFLSEEAERVLTKRTRIQAFCWVLFGAAGMSVVGAFA